MVTLKVSSMRKAQIQQVNGFRSQVSHQHAFRADLFRRNAQHLHQQRLQPLKNLVLGHHLLSVGRHHS